MSEPIRYTFEAKEVLDANGMVCFVGVSTLTHPMGKYVAYEDYAKLRMERIHDINQIGGQCEEIARLKATAERYRLASLQGDVARLENARLKAECQARQAENSVLAVECDSLKAEVERLTKAGDLMCRMAGNNQVINRHWKTAKKGVQS